MGKIVRWIILIVVVGIIATPFVYVQVNKMIYADRVMSYLLTEKHYKPEQIKSVTGLWTIKLPPFCASVVFADEPEAQYIYFAHNGVKQFGHRLTEDAQQRGITKEEWKHFEPVDQ